jgi:hypothetical protein
MPEELRCLRRHDALCGGGGFCLFLGARERSGRGEEGRGGESVEQELWLRLDHDGKGRGLLWDLYCPCLAMRSGHQAIGVALVFGVRIPSSSLKQINNAGNRRLLGWTFVFSSSR